MYSKNWVFVYKNYHESMLESNLAFTRGNTAGRYNSKVLNMQLSVGKLCISQWKINTRFSIWNSSEK